MLWTLEISNYEQGPTDRGLVCNFPLVQEMWHQTYMK